MSRKLGRGNPALAAPAVVPQDSSMNRLFGTSRDFPELRELDVEQIRPNPTQPRRHFDEDALRALAGSIERQGLLQPILVRKGEGGYVIAAGERRWRAHQLLGRPTIFAIVTPGDLDEVALVENLQRQDLDVLETAAGIARLCAAHGYTQEQGGAVVGLSKSETSRLLALTALPASIQEEYPSFRTAVSKSHMLLLADAQDDGERRALWERIKSGATIRELRDLRRQPLPGPSRSPVPPARKSASPLVRTAEKLDGLLGQANAGHTMLDDDERACLEALHRRIGAVLGH
ncbi:MAG: hypothetical protein RLY86_2752 [Pseudomonadota bacterium]